MRRSDRQRHRARVVLGRVTEVLATTAAVLATAARWRKEVKGREDYPEPGEPEPALHPLAHRDPLGED